MAAGGLKHDLVRAAKLFTPRQMALRAYRRYLKRLPINPSSVLLDQQNGTTLDGNVYYLLRELLENPRYANLDVYWATTQQTNARFSKELSRRGLSVKTVRRGTRAYLHALASAHWLFCDNAFPPYFIKRKGQVLANAWHGIPLKTLGRRQASDAYLIGNVQRNLALSDYLLFPNPTMEQRMLRDYMLDGLCEATVLPLGYPRNEPFLMPRESRSNRVYAWLPTFRSRGDDARALPIDLERRLRELDELLTDDETLLLKLHPASSSGLDLNGCSHIRTFPNDREAYEVLAGCDVLITDYSSVLYDFPLGGGKVVLFPLDEREYSTRHGLYEGLDALPFPKADSVPELVEYLRMPKDYDDSAFLASSWPTATKDAARVFLERVIDGIPVPGEHAVPHLQLPTALVYSELRDDLDSLTKDLKARARTHALRVVFPMERGKDQAEFFADLPGEVSFSPLQYAPVATLPERLAASSRYRAHYKLGLKQAESYFALERSRLFGQARFDAVSIHDGNDTRWTAVIEAIKKASSLV